VARDHVGALPLIEQFVTALDAPGVSRCPEH
jgi:hypothetical protein